MASERTYLDNPYRRGWRVIPGKAVRNSENDYRELRGEHPAWIKREWYPPDHVAQSPVDTPDQAMQDTEGFLQ